MPSPRHLACALACLSSLVLTFCVEAVARAGATVTASGTAFSFSIEGGYVVGAEVYVLERPDLGTTLTDEVGAFEIAGLEAGSQATFVVRAPDYHPTQTATFAVGSEDLTEVNFQVPPDLMYQALSLWLRFLPDPRKCQIVTTVTRWDSSPYIVPHGDDGAVVTLSPSEGAEVGPVYFQYLTDAFILPMYYLQETSIDGGVLFLNVTPGQYVLHAEQAGTTYADALMNCRAGVLVNAAPPYGLPEAPPAP